MNPSDFKAIMGTFPTGVVVVTAVDESGVPHGATLNSVCSVSITPPLLLICLAHASQTLPVLRRQGRFLVNFLAQGSSHVSRIFAGKSADKFDGVDWRLTRSGNALLHNDAVAFAECTTYDDIEAGDHAVIIGEAYAGEGPTLDGQPLLYFRRRYDQWPVFDGAGLSSSACSRAALAG